MAGKRTGLRKRLLAMVPAGEARPRLSALTQALRARVQQALDLPSNHELNAALLQLDELTRRLENVAAAQEQVSGQVSELRDSSEAARLESLAHVEAQAKRVKKLKKQIRRGIKKGKKSVKPSIDVASPKTVKQRRSKPKKP